MSSRIKNSILKLKESSTLVINEKSKEVFVVVDEEKFPNERLEGGVAMVRQPMDGATDVVVK